MASIENESFAGHIRKKSLITYFFVQVLFERDCVKKSPHSLHRCGVELEAIAGQFTMCNRKFFMSEILSVEEEKSNGRKLGGSRGRKQGALKRSWGGSQ